MKDLGNCKVLLVDDTKSNIDILVKALKDEYKIAVALDGETALKHAKENPLDLILLDILMPGLDGFEVCRMLKEDTVTQNIPIIFITALDESKDKTRGFEMGAVDYITKPFDIAEVKARVKTHLSLRIAQEALKIQNIVLEVKVKERTRELRKNQKDLLDRLGLVAEFRDSDISAHTRRMAAFTEVLGKAAGLSEEQCETLSLASIVHDIGKVAIPEKILSKPKKLSRKEFDIIKSHAAIGAKLLSGSKSKLLQAAETIAETHHEKWDGSGYPKGLKEREIPISGRVVAILDVFDALISKRPYKAPWPIEKAIAEIRAGAATHFDPELVRHFLNNANEITKIAAAGN